LTLSLLDLSELGARIEVKCGLQNGQDVELAFSAPGRSQPIKLMARVIWWQRRSEGKYVIGAQFERALSYTELSSLAMDSGISVRPGLRQTSGARATSKAPAGSTGVASGKVRGVSPTS
jgi:hypothetical protein